VLFPIVVLSFSLPSGAQFDSHPVGVMLFPLLLDNSSTHTSNGAHMGRVSEATNTTKPSDRHHKQQPLNHISSIQNLPLSIMTTLMCQNSTCPTPRMIYLSNLNPARNVLSCTSPSLAWVLLL